MSVRHYPSNGTSDHCVRDLQSGLQSLPREILGSDCLAGPAPRPSGCCTGWSASTWLALLTNVLAQKCRLPSPFPMSTN